MNLWEWFWFAMVWSSALWYVLLVLVVGVRGCKDMLRLLRDTSGPEESSPASLGDESDDLEA